MKLLEALEIIERDPELKKLFISKCIEEMGEVIIVKKVIWNDVDLPNQDKSQHNAELRIGINRAVIDKFSYVDTRDEEEVHESIIRSMRLKEYNDIRIARDIMREVPFKTIAHTYQVTMPYIRRIKKKLYEAIKKGL